MNIVLVIIDTLRQDHVGAYGNDWIVTPHLDAFARESVRFTRTYPESLPTLPVRRAIHSGRRTFPFHGHRDYKGDFSGAPGWGPIPEEQDTVAEMLSRAGYRTALFTDCYHQFKPSKNFHRGFDEWHWIRGQEHDRRRSGPDVPAERIAQHLNCPPEEDPVMFEFLSKYLRNNSDRRTEADYFPARLFTDASRWVWDNADAERFFLVVDSFDPHEPWDPPDAYRRMYDPEDDCADVIQSPYEPWKDSLTEREVRRLQANYSGEVTLVDRWLGFFLETVRRAGRLDDTAIVIASDHGHNLGYDPGDKGLISKQGHPMTHAVADLVLMIRHPDGTGAGTVCEDLAYVHDVTATTLGFAGVEPTQALDGIDLWPTVTSGRPTREYVTVAWGPLVTVIDDHWWYNASIWGKGPLLYDVVKDRELTTSLADENPQVCEQLLARAVEDAGGRIPAHFAEFETKPGCTPFSGRSRKDIMDV